MRSKFLHEGKEPSTTCNIISAAAAAGITAGIGAASAIGSSVANGVTATKLNKKNRLWQEKMYERRLADERSNWDMENEYNSPVQQVERMRAAGINPDLYGIDGAGTASQINTPDANFEYQAPDFSQGFQILSGIFESVMNMQSQVIDNDLKITDERGKLSGLFNLLLGTGSDSSQVVDYLTKGLSKGLSRSFKKNKFGITSDNAFGIHREELIDRIAKIRGQAGYNSNPDTFAKFLRLSNEILLDAQNAEKGYRADYYNNQSGEIDAGLDTENKRLRNQGQDISNTNARNQGQKTEFESKIFDKINEFSRENPTLGAVLSMFYLVLQNR